MALLTSISCGAAESGSREVDDGRKSSIDLLGDIWCLSDGEFAELLEQHLARPDQRVPAVRVFVLDMWTIDIPQCGECEGFFPCPDYFPYRRTGRGYDLSGLSGKFSDRFRTRIASLLRCGITPIICLREYAAMVKTSCPSFRDHPYRRDNNLQGWGGVKPQQSAADTEHFGRLLIDMLVRALEPASRNQVIWEVGNQPPLWAFESEAEMVDALYAYYQDSGNRRILKLAPLSKSRVWMTLFAINQARRFLELRLDEKVGVVSVHNICTLSSWVARKQAIERSRGGGRTWVTPLIPNSDGAEGFWTGSGSAKPCCVPVSPDVWERNLVELQNIIREGGFFGALWEACLYRTTKTAYLARLDDVIRTLR